MKRLPPLFEGGYYGCPYCGSPDIEFRDFRTQDRSFAMAGQCHGVEGGDKGTRHRWVVTFAPTPNGMLLKVTLLHEDVNFPGRPSQPIAPRMSTPEWPGAATHLERQLEASLRQLGIDPNDIRGAKQQSLADAILGPLDKNKNDIP